MIAKSMGRSRTIKWMVWPDCSPRSDQWKKGPRDLCAIVKNHPYRRPSGRYIEPCKPVLCIKTHENRRSSRRAPVVISAIGAVNGHPSRQSSTGPSFFTCLDGQHSAHRIVDMLVRRQHLDDEILEPGEVLGLYAVRQKSLSPETIRKPPGTLAATRRSNA